MMPKVPFVELVLTCGSWQEAQKIVDSLLGQKLIACAEFLEVKSRFQWKGDIETNDEIKLIMTTISDHFDTIEQEIKKLHSYETFVLQQIPITHINQAAADWLSEDT
jgi:periplasmic divalent cation tolerance protein